MRNHFGLGKDIDDTLTKDIGNLFRFKKEN